MRTALIAVLAGAALVAAGCGGSSSDSAPATTAADTTAASTATTDTTAASTAMTDTSTASGDSGISDAAAAAAGLSAGCKKVANLSVEFGKALSAAGASGEGAEADLEKTATAYKAFAAQVPEEIRGAFQTVAAAFAKYAEVLKGVDLTSGQTPDPSTIAKLAKAAQELDNAKLTAANEEISTWVQENCSTGG